jgi:integrase
MPKRSTPLSAKQLSAAKPGKVPIELIDGLVPGLRVRVMPSGTHTWSLSIRDSKGVRRRFVVGSGLKLAEARRQADELRQAVRAGADPTATRRGARRRAEAARDGNGTLAALIEVYFANGPGATQRRASRSKQLVLTVFEKLAILPALDIDRADLQLAADGWGSKSTASLAVRILRPVLKWAAKRGYAQAGVADLDQPGKIGKRERVLSADEVKWVWLKLNGQRGDVMRWLLWTGCRLNEAAGITWGEVNGSLWTIPALRSKNGRERSIPLPRQAVELLSQRQTGQPHDLVFPSTRGGQLSNWDRETKKLQAASGTSGWHRHDLRRTAATMLGDIGVAPHVVSVVLGHTHIAEGATAVYARSRYQREHQEALQALADEINRIVTGQGNVVRLTARGSGA